MASPLTSKQYAKDTSYANNNDSSGLKIRTYNFDTMYTRLLGKGSESLNKYKDEYPGENDDTSSTAGGVSMKSQTHQQNCELRRPPSPHLLKKTFKLVNGLHKLNWFQQQDQIIRFLHRCNVTHSPFTDSCLTTLIPVVGESEEKPLYSGSGGGENKKKKCSNSNIKVKEKRGLSSIGPFLSCPGRHGRGPDYEVFPWFMKPSEVSLRQVQQSAITDERTNSVAQPRPNSSPSVPSDFKCRHCPKTIIGAQLDSDLLYEDYKANVTFGKVDQSYKKRILERYRSFLDNEDAESCRPESSKGKYALNRTSVARDKFIEAAPFSLPFHTPRNKNTEGQPSDPAKEIVYGPAAIASVSGYNYKKKANPELQQPKIKPNYNILMPKKPPEGTGSHKEQNQVPSIPFPTDNVRYYDDDVDPEIVEHLTKAPLTFGPDAGSIQGLANMAIGSFSTVISVQDPQTIIYEYTIGSGQLESNSYSPRVGKKPLTNRSQRAKPLPDPTTNKLLRSNEGVTARKKNPIGVRNSARKNEILKTPASGRKLSETKPPAPTKLIKESKQKDTTIRTSRNPERESKTRPMSVLVSPRPPKTVHSSSRKPKVKSLSKKNSSKTRRFNQSISTVKLPTPSSKCKPRNQILSA